MPVSFNDYKFTEGDGTTTAVFTSVYETAEALQQVLDMRASSRAPRPRSTRSTSCLQVELAHHRLRWILNRWWGDGSCQLLRTARIGPGDHRPVWVSDADVQVGCALWHKRFQAHEGTSRGPSRYAGTTAALSRTVRCR